MRYSDLVRQIGERDKTLKSGGIAGAMFDIDKKMSDKVYKPERGLFRLTEFRDKQTGELKEGLIPTPSTKVVETDFYAPFADWITNELEECTKAIPLGGKVFGDKWGTPDVIGKRESKKRDLLRMPTEIVSAEVKTDTHQLITAFGQACAYSLFSHKSYLVIPKNSPQDDISRLDSLCRGFGIGLVLFDSTAPQNPDFEIRVRPQRHEPDMFYTNKYRFFAVWSG